MISVRRIFGDVQTPPELARSVCQWIGANTSAPTLILEPTCGDGAFLEAARTEFGDIPMLGMELSREHLDRAQARVPSAMLEEADAFEVDWSARIAELPSGALILGNPPWTTTSVQGRDGAQNRPASAEGPTGLDAVTGASNFDVSEWLMRRWLEALRPGDTLAMLIKRSVARRILSWTRARPWSTLSVQFDSRRAFDAAVDAELFVARVDPSEHRRFDSFDSTTPTRWIQRFGAWVRDDAPLDVDVIGEATTPSPWRSGLKHDRRRLFELTPVEPGRYQSDLDADLRLEDEVVFPLLKSTDLARGRDATRAVLVTQRHLNDDPSELAQRAPEAWAYLQRHRTEAGARKSRVYRDRPAFSQFGVGDYSFAPHKVAVSGLHWPPRFRALGPLEGKPVLLDDTCYFLPCTDLEHARDLARWLNRDLTRQNLEAFADPEAKRPVTKGLLSRLRLPRVG